MSYVRVKAVLISVNFDDQLGSKATEIRDIRANRNLSPEMSSFQGQSVLEMPPELLLWFRERST